MSMALEGIKVVEVASIGAGPWIGTIMGYYGAEITKIENPQGGDQMRASRAYPFEPYATYDYFWQFGGVNKKSTAMNLTMKRGQEIAHRLVEKADVFISNTQYASLKKLNMEYETLSRINPRLVYAHVTAFGEEGAERDRSGLDMTGWARSGIMHRLGEPLRFDPGGFIDLTTATYTTLAVLLGLQARERTGKGQKVTNSLFGTACWSAGYEFQPVLATGRDWVPMGHKDELRSALSGTYQTKDGIWLAFVNPERGRYWPNLCQALGVPELEKDPRFDTMDKRNANHKELIAIFRNILSNKTLAEWEAASEGIDIIWQKLQTYTEAVNDPQAKANGFFPTFNHPTLGEIKLSAPPAKMTQTPGSFRTPAPQLGQHTEEVLLEAGYSWEDIARFKEEGVIN